MKAFGSVLAFIGGLSLFAGVVMILLSLKNMSDLFIWAELGIVAGIFGLVVLAVGVTMASVKSP